MILLSANVYGIDLPIIYGVYLIIISLITFLLYGADKLKAQRRAWRVPEKILLLFSIFGGAFGGLIGMKVFRHKTTKEHWYFTFINILGVGIHVGLFITLLFFI